MSVNIELRNFIELFDTTTVQYVIPKWQRRYSWEKDTIDQLILDLKSIAKDKDEEVMHFGGTLITHSEDNTLVGTRVAKVVDGQQRLTTISLLLICIAEAKKGIPEADDRWSSQQIREVLLENRLRPHNKLRLQDGDNEDYKNILRGKARGSGKVTEAYRHLRKVVGESDPDFLMQGLRRFKVITFPCASSHDPQQIFESLNSTGVPLTEGEKVKNWILMGLNDETQEEMYVEHWSQIENALDAVSEPKRVDEFLRDFLRWKTGENKGIKHTYSSLRRWFKEYPHNKPYLCRELDRLSVLYGMITGARKPGRSDKTERILQHLRQLGISVYRPLALRFLDDATRPEDTGASEGEVIRALEALSIWLTRLWVADRKTAGVNTAIIELAYRGRPPSHESYADYWIGEIRRFRNSGVSVPNSEEIRKGVQSRKAYGGKASDAARTILWEINARLVRDVSPGIEVLSLEHIMPTKLSSEWRAYLGDDCEELERVYVNTLANLTLVGGEYNSTMGNSLYAKKREMYGESSVILTRKLAEQYDEWRKKEMDMRADELADWILEFWPWEDTIWAQTRWRINGGEWQKEKKYSVMFLNIIAALLNTDHARNSHQLLGSRPGRDIFYSGTEPISTGRRFLPIPGYDQYVVNMNFNRRTILRLCGDMSERCNAKVEIEIPEKQYEDQEVWNRVDLKGDQILDTKRTVLHWRINQGGWRQAKSYTDMLLSVIAALLDTDQRRNSEQLLGNRAHKDIFRSGAEPLSRGRRFRVIPGHPQYVVNVNHSGRSIVILCIEMGERCGVEVDIKHSEEQDERSRRVWEESTSEYLVPRWRIGDTDWNEEQSHKDVLLKVTSALLDIDPERNYYRLSGERITKDVFPDYVHSDERDFGRIPGYSQYVIYTNLTRSKIIKKCRELGDRCGISVDVE